MFRVTSLLNRLFLLLPLLGLFSATADAQLNIQGIVNTYFKVTHVDPCMITTSGSSYLFKDQRIIIIQMSGASVDGDGNITDLNGAGYWEVATVAEDVTDTRITLKHQLANPAIFDVRSNVQIIAFPPLPTPSTTVQVVGPITGLPWDPDQGVGGVVALIAPEMRILGDIDATGLGYGRDFRVLTNGKSAAFCGRASDAAFTGDGPAPIGDFASQNPRATGGGGGINHNSGGGGGANYGNGGAGGEGFQNPRCGAAHPPGGKGALGYTDYSDGTVPRALMGGAGGDGHQNNGEGSYGGRGGGIVIIVADQLNAAGTAQGPGHPPLPRPIISNGTDGLPSGNDGAGGGGAGGTIIVYSLKSVVPSILRFEAKGGKGGDMGGLDEHNGPGGGGGGGVVMVKTGSSIASSRYDLSGGQPGTQSKFGSSQNAQTGQAGALLEILDKPTEGSGDVSALTISEDGPLEFCEGGEVTLTASMPDVTWKKMEDSRFEQAGPMLRVVDGGTYIAEAVVDGCTIIASRKVIVHGAPVYSMGSAKDLPPCGGAFILGTGPAYGGTEPYTYVWETDDPSSVNPEDLNKPQFLARPTKTTWYKVTVTDALGCTFTDEFTYEFSEPIDYHAPDVETCMGTDVTIGIAPKGGKEPLEFVWTPAAGLDNPGVPMPTAIAPTANQRYIVRITDYNGCRTFDTVMLTVLPLPTTAASPDTITCASAGAQLTASGGTRYLWSPADGLSCTDCPNPVAKPAVTTTYSVVITDAKGCSRTESVTVTVRTPKLSAAIGSLDFGQLEGCRASATRTFYLRNDDSLPIDINDQQLSAAGFTVIEPPLPATIRAHDSIRVVVRFAPTTSGVTSSRLTLLGQCDALFAIDLSGEQPTTAVSASLGVVNFGQSLACNTLSRDTVIVVTNTGTAPISFGAPIVAPPFQVLYPPVPPTLQPSDTAHIVVRYAPSTAGTYSLDLLLPYVAGACEDTLRVALNGTNIRPAAAVDITTIAFPELVGCNLQSDTIITISNTSSIPVALKLLSITPGFRVVSAVPPTLPPDESRPITLRFEPVTQGNASGTATFLYGPCNDTIRVALSGSSQGVSFAIADSLNFGELVWCDQQTGTLRFSITNTSAGSTDGSISSVSVTGPFTTTLAGGETLPNGTPRQFDVTFQPVADGDATGTIEITLEPCGVRRIIHLTGSRTNAVLAVNGPGSVSFGSVPIAQTRTQTIRFVNNGSATLRNVTLAGVALPFRIVSSTPPIPAMLAPGEELVVEVSYEGTGGTQNGRVQAVSEDPCTVMAEVLLDGRGDIAATSIVLPDFTAAPGEHVTVPLLAGGTQDLPSIGVDSFTATIRYRRTMLIVARQSAPAVTSDDVKVDPNDSEFMLYTFTAPLALGDTLARLQFVVAIGDGQQTPVTIESFMWSSPSVTVDLTSGTFTLQEVCVTGSTRLVAADGNFALKPVRPNPVASSMEIEYELVEDGQTELVITDIRGREVAVLLRGQAKPGRYVMTVDASRLESGSYFYTLRTPTQQITRRVDVVK